MEEFLPKETRGACVACGSSPASHTHTYIASTIDAWLSDTVRALPMLQHALSRVQIAASHLESPLLKLVYYTCGMKTFTDPSRVSTHRAVVLWQEAERRDLSMEQIAVFGSPSDCYRARIDGEWLYFEGLPVPRRGASSYAWLDDKFLFKRFLNEHGIAAAEGGMATTIDEARSIFERLTAPVVVKPRRGSRARHTATNIWTREQLDSAFLSAKQLCRYVVIEEHLRGKLCRATAVDGKLVGFLKKSYPTVTGDGVSTIGELVARKNADKPERVWDIVLDDENILYLERQGITPESVLPAGETIEVSQNTGRQVGGDTREMPQEIHIKLRAYLEGIARTLDLPIVGFDLIIPDPEADPDTQKWGILEANSLPFIDLHYSPLYGEPSNIAAAVWDLWQEKGAEKNPA
jgi:cyanophycin synthetase